MRSSEPVGAFSPVPLANEALYNEKFCESSLESFLDQKNLNGDNRMAVRNELAFYFFPQLQQELICNYDPSIHLLSPLIPHSGSWGAGAIPSHFRAKAGYTVDKSPGHLKTRARRRKLSMER